MELWSYGVMELWNYGMLKYKGNFREDQIEEKKKRVHIRS